MFKFYVYEILNQYDEVIYVGKGTKSRMTSSLKIRGGSNSRAVAYFKREVDAYAYEIERIAQYQNLLNMNKGGGGNAGGASRDVIYKPDWHQSKLAIAGLAKCLKIYEAGYACKLASLDLYQFAISSIKRIVTEFGFDKVSDQFRAHGVDVKAHYV